MPIILNQKPTGGKKKLLIIISTLVVLLLGGAGLYYAFVYERPSDIPDGISGSSEINYGPPTEDEQKAGDDQKSEVIDRQKVEEDATPASTATIVISDASYYSDDNTVEVRASIANIIEDGGTCTATFTQGSQTVTATSQAFKDARSTQCGSLNVERSRFPSGGSWNLELTYSSSSATGRQTTTVNLQ